MMDPDTVEAEEETKKTGNMTPVYSTRISEVDNDKEQKPLP